MSKNKNKVEQKPKQVEIRPNYRISVIPQGQSKELEQALNLNYMDGYKYVDSMPVTGNMLLIICGLMKS